MLSILRERETEREREITVHPARYFTVRRRLVECLTDTEYLAVGDTCRPISQPAPRPTREVFYGPGFPAEGTVISAYAVPFPGNESCTQ